MSSNAIAAMAVVLVSGFAGCAATARAAEAPVLAPALAVARPATAIVAPVRAAFAPVFTTTKSAARVAVFIAPAAHSR